ncbi:MAG: DUF4231 domain-containing protein [Actinomycetota bacterium]
MDTSEAPDDRSAVERVWARQQAYDRLAVRTRARLDRLRLANLVLLGTGALLGAIAAQSLPRAVTAVVGAAGAGALLLAGFAQREAASGHAERWTMARGAAEALRAAVHEYLVGTPPFDDHGRDEDLATVSERIAETVRTLDVELVDVEGPDDPLPAVSDLASYVELRVRGQARWHDGKISEHRGAARRLRRLELAATLAGAALTGIASLLDSSAFGVWIGVATTIGSAVAAHLDATRHTQIAAGYATTARRLDELLDRYDVADAVDAAAFVGAAESILERQNENWIGLVGAMPAAPTR